MALKEKLTYSEFKFYSNKQNKTIKLSNIISSFGILFFVISLRISFLASLITLFVINELYYVVVYALYLFYNKKR